MSVELMKRYCASRSAGCAPIQTADPAFELQAEKKKPARQWVYDQIGLRDREKKTVLLVPANDKLSETGYVESLIDCGRRLAKSDWQVFGWMTDLQPTYDQRLMKLPEWKTICGFRWLPQELYRKSEFARITAGVDLVVSARMHPLIAAFTQLTPSVVLARNTKMQTFARMCQLPVLSTSGLSGGQLYDMCSQASLDMGSAAYSVIRERRRAESEAVARVFSEAFLPLLSHR